MHRRVVLLCYLLLFAPSVRAADPGIELFENKIRPILVERCYSCHAAQKKTKGGLALDSKEGLLKGGDSGPAIVRGNPAESPLLRAVRYADEPKMPPDGKLPDSVIADLEKWIALGAPDPRTGAAKLTVEQARERWAFQPLPKLSRHRLPASQLIDRLVAAKLAEKQLTLSPLADARTLIRRLYLDLLGLPPTPEQVAAFLQDSSSTAYEKLVDQLLSSPHFGERWARHWLDVARFAESSGYEHDNDRPHAYQYRDFVIQALNGDLPFDKFVQWQIAGDELEPNNPQALKATGFLSAGLMNGQVTEREVEKERYEVLDDWVGTIGTAFLGLTIGCARCHDHKFDPISAEDYYRLAAHFTSTVRVNQNVPHDPPIARRQIDAHHHHVAALKGAVQAFEAGAAVPMAKSWQGRPSTLPQAPWLILTADNLQKDKTRRGLDSDFDLTQQPDGSYLFTRINGDVGPINLTVHTMLEQIAYLRFEALTDETLPNYGPGLGDHGNFQIDKIELSVSQPNGQSQAIKLDKVTTSTGDKPGGAGWHVGGKHAGRDHAAIFRLAEPVGRSAGATITVTIRCPGDSPSARQTIGRFRLAFGLVDVEPSLVGVDMMLTDYERGLREFGGESLAPAVVKLYCLADAEWLRLDALVRSAQRDWRWPAHAVAFGVGENVLPYRMMIQGPDLLAATHVLKRGDPNKKDGIATPAPLPLLARGSPERWHVPPPVGAGTSHRRAALARWLTDVEQGAGGLVARVMVNRMWQHHFGRGIVGTPSDFGLQGDSPSHQELLDQLAAELVQSGWSLKAMHKQIVMSATYRQASEHRPDAAAIDAGNQLLWRYQPRRLEAEAIRDGMLAVSGRLDSRPFGPGALAESHLRRSIYFTVKRSKLIPSLVALDWPEALTGVGRRTSTTVPTQALWALNNPQVRAYADALAGKLKDLPLDDAVTRGYELTVARPPSAAERDAARRFLETDFESRCNDFAHTLLMRSEFVTIR